MITREGITKAFAVMMAVLMAAEGLWMDLAWAQQAKQEEKQETVAVLDFRNASGDMELDYLTKAIPENIITYLRHRVTNAASESINAKIQWVKYTARGFRNLRNFIHAIYFHCGGLDLYPAAVRISQ